MNDGIHGTDSCYHNHHCRCPLCKSAHAKANILSQRRYVAQLHADGFRQKWVNLKTKTILVKKYVRRSFTFN